MKRITLYYASLLVFFTIGVKAQEINPLSEFLRTLPAKVGTPALDMPNASQMIAQVTLGDAAQVAAALPFLSDALQNSDWRVQMVGMVVARTLAERPNSAVELAPIYPALLPLLRSQRHEVRAFVPTVVEHLRPISPDIAVAALQESLNDLSPNGAGRNEVTGTLSALVEMRPQDVVITKVVWAYIQSLQSDPALQADAIELIANKNPSDDLASKVIDLFRSTPSERVREACIHAFQRIGSRAISKVRPDLELILSTKDESPSVKQAAALALHATP